METDTNINQHIFEMPKRVLLPVQAQAEDETKHPFG